MKFWTNERRKHLAKTFQYTGLIAVGWVLLGHFPAVTVAILIAAAVLLEVAGVAVEPTQEK